MAIRLRKMNGRWVALCAAKTKAEAGDVYLDDSMDHALRLKLSGDFKAEGVAGLWYDYDPLAVEAGGE